MSKQSRVLWVGDAVVRTGFGKVTENVCTRLHAKDWDVRVFGVGYNGDPHDFPYKIYPCLDSRGTGRISDIVKGLKPDVIVIQDDSWNVGMLIDHMNMLNLGVPTIGHVIVDSENVRANVASQLKLLKHIVCPTQFGVEQLVKAGYSGPLSVCPHGVNTEIYAPYDKIEARRGIGYDDGSLDNAFIFGTIAANQPRKRLDLTMQYFATWWQLAGKPSNAYLYIHTYANGEYDLRQLADYLGIRGRLLETDGGARLRDEHMPTLINAFDVLISTSEAEGFGLPHLEAMACGVPQVAVNTGAMPSWAGDAIHWVNPAVPHFLESRIGAKRWAVAEEPFVNAMQDMYSNAGLRKQYIDRGLSLSKSFTWDDLGSHFDSVLHKILDRKRFATQTDSDCLTEFA